MGIHRTFPGEVEVLPYYFLRLSVPEPFVESRIAQIITFINNMGSETLTSKFITFAVQLLQIETGQTDTILLQNYNRLQNLATDSWIKLLWEFVIGQNIQIKSPKRLIPNQIRVNDTVIINEFIRHIFDEVDLVRLNQVRNHFKVLYMSDITEGNDKRIKTSIFNGVQDCTTTSNYGWRQENPAKNLQTMENSNE